jgi:chromosome partitioning protein
MLENAMSAADCIVVPTRVGGVETARAEEVFEMVPRKTPAGLVICSARTYTRDYQDAITAWRAAQVPVWGSVPERVTQPPAGPTPSSRYTADLSCSFRATIASGSMRSEPSSYQALAAG